MGIERLSNTSATNSRKQTLVVDRLPTAGGTPSPRGRREDSIPPYGNKPTSGWSTRSAPRGVGPPGRRNGLLKNPLSHVIDINARSHFRSSARGQRERRGTTDVSVSAERTRDVHRGKDMKPFRDMPSSARRHHHLSDLGSPTIPRLFPRSASWLFRPCSASSPGTPWPTCGKRPGCDSTRHQDQSPRKISNCHGFF